MEFLYISIELWSVRVEIFISDYGGFIFYKFVLVLKYVVFRKGVVFDW